MKQNTIATYEMGRSIPSDPTIKSICREFNVNETWLRTGDGDMFIQRKPEDELAAAVERLITGKSADFKRRLVLALSALKDEHWALLEQKLTEIIGQADHPPAVQTIAPPPAEPEPAPAPDLAKELAGLKCQNEEVMRQNQQLAKLVAEQRKEIDQIKLEDSLEALFADQPETTKHQV